MRLKNSIPHGGVVLLFIVIALAYFYPILQGKKIYQSDIVQFRGMVQEQKTFREDTQTETYWSNSAFTGMPTYQVGAIYPHDYIKKLDRFILLLPRPAGYVFLYFIGFYILLIVLKVNWPLAFAGALAFGFSTYLIIIIGVGHNSKAHAIGYFSLVLAGIFLTFQRKYLWGAMLTAIALALEINANHLQMTYYLMLLVIIIGIVYGIESYRKKTLPSFFKAVGLLFGALLLALTINATRILSTYEYAGWSTRSKSELTIAPDGTPKTVSEGLSRDYITSYSYGILESLNLFVPRLMGGGSGEQLDEDTKTYAFLINQGVPKHQASDFVKRLPAYWGNQYFVEAPAYIGAVVFFLFILALFVLKGPLKWWLTAGILLSLLLSWGSNFSILTDMMIDHFPLYDKFRAVASAQVILELCIPILAILGLAHIMGDAITLRYKQKVLYYTLSITSGILILLLLFKNSFDFMGSNDEAYRQAFGDSLMEIIRMDRKAIYNQDIFRSFFFVLLSFVIIWWYLKKRLHKKYVVALFAILFLADMASVATRYVNKDDFVNSRTVEKPFQPTAADATILKDTGYYRVLEPALGLSSSRTSYFHKAIGGYHGAKPRLFQELYDFHIVNNNMEVLHMLNVKYILRQNEEGTPVALTNPYANGNAWFVEHLLVKNSANDEIQALQSLDTKREAVVNRTNIADLSLPTTFKKDTTASIKLLDYQPNHLTYTSNNMFEGLAVFSELYYPHGWKVTIDDAEATYFRANYALRAMRIPSGTHRIEFTFDPDVIRRGSAISMAGTLLFGLLFIGVLFYKFKKWRRSQQQQKL